jgi:hypothetical protein
VARGEGRGRNSRAPRLPSSYPGSRVCRSAHSTEGTPHSWLALARR